MQSFWEPSLGNIISSKGGNEFNNNVMQVIKLP